MANLWEGSGQVLVDGNGAPYASWKLYTYATGTTTNLATYSEASLTTPNTNPIVADANGRMGDVYLSAARYKLVFKTSADVTIKTIDPYDSSSQLITATAAPSPTYSLMEYVNSTDGHRYRRSLDNTSWIDLGLANSLGNAATVAQILAGTDTTSFGTADSIAALWQRGTDIASATTLSLPSTGGRVFNITGTTTINGIGSAVGGTCLKLKFVGALTLTHNATSFILPGAANITTVAGDCAEFINEAATDGIGSNWRCFNYQRSSGSPINLTDNIAPQATMETATSTTLVPSVNNLKFHPGVVKAYVQFDASSTTPTAGSPSLNFSSFTDNGVGDFTFNFTTSFSAATYAPAGTSQRAITNSGSFLATKQGVAPTTSAYRFMTVDDAAGPVDTAYGALHITGDFA